MKTLTHLKPTILLIPAAIVLLCFGLSPTAKALLPPPSPDGGYPGGNTAEGFNALHDVNTALGINNTAVGANALTNDTTGQYNVAVGSGALQSNTTGFQNMAIGAEALANSNGNFNMAIGFRALFMNTGNRNSAIGAAALRNNTTASDNTAIGSTAMRENTTGENNTATGAAALFNNIDGSFNVAIGDDAGSNINGAGVAGDGSANVTVGQGAAPGSGLGITSGHNNTCVGFDVGLGITSGNNNTILGSAAGTDIHTKNSNIYIGAGVNPSGAVTESGFIRIADSNPQVGGTTSQVFFGGIVGSTVGAANAPVIINPNGQLGTAVSSRRFKKDIDPMGKTSEAIFSLRPVTFHYKGDETNLSCFGLIAEEVAKVNPDLILLDKEGRPQTVRYEQINAMLLNEFLKEHRTVQEQKAIVALLKQDFESKLALQQKQIEALTAGLQKVSAQFEASKPAPQVVNNP